MTNPENSETSGHPSDGRQRSRRPRPALRRRILFAVVVGFCLMQVPQPDRSRPQSTSTTIWEDPGLPPAVGEILDRSCSDCHSHRTEWPWYSYVAPVSWLVSHDVHEGRQHLDLSRWGELGVYRRYKLLEEMCEEVESDEMPLKIYRPMHPGARLSKADVTTLCDWTRTARKALGGPVPGPTEGRTEDESGD